MSQSNPHPQKRPVIITGSSGLIGVAEKVEAKLSRLDFTFELVEATSGECFGTIRIPFTICKG
jgi:hypothetical protein